MDSIKNKVRFPKLRFSCDLQMRTRRSPSRIRWSISMMYLVPTGVDDGHGFFSSASSFSTVSSRCGSITKQTEKITIVRVNARETLSAIFFVLRCQIHD